MCADGQTNNDAKRNRNVMHTHTKKHAGGSVSSARARLLADDDMADDVLMVFCAVYVCLYVCDCDPMGWFICTSVCRHANFELKRLSPEFA